MNKFIHIGMPKTLTSALQKEFYPNHEQIYYLGIGNDRLIDYIDDDVNFIFETLILYAKYHYYNCHKEYALEVINKHINEALKKSKKAIGLSLEWLSFNFSPDMIDEHIKVKRLYELFGSDTKIILFIRNQKHLLESLYKEYIKVGLPFTFNEFIEYTYNFKDRNFYFNLFYDKKYQLYADYFKEENMYFIPLELYRGDDNKLSMENNRIKMIDKICRIIGVDYPDGFSLPYVNSSLSDSEAFHKLNLNRKYRHDFGNLIFEHSNIHRSRKYFTREKVLGINDYFKDVKIKRLLLHQAKMLSKNDSRKIDYYVKKETWEKIKKDFITSNKKLSKEYGINLPEEYYKLDF